MESDGDLHLVKDLMGHKSITVTSDIYGHFCPRGGDRVKRVLNTMKVQRLQAVAA
jgi:integrase